MLRWVDAISEFVGKLASWLCLGMVLLAAYNTLARWLGRSLGADLSSNALLEGQWYLFSLVFLLGASATLRRDEHVRVDVLYSRLSARGRAWVNLLGGLFLLLPFCVFALIVSWEPVAQSFAVSEQSPDPGGLPRYPLKACLLLAFGLLLLQGVAFVGRAAGALLGSGEGVSESPGAKGPTL
jgi:TRAP-type mannitol/chloroaromatic compound transport system permease small subunit